MFKLTVKVTSITELYNRILNIKRNAKGVGKQRILKKIKYIYMYIVNWELVTIPTTGGWGYISF